MAAAIEPAGPALLASEDLSKLDELSGRLQRDQLIWASGYLAGAAKARQEPFPSPALQPVAATADDNWTVLYATETGNSKRVAEAIVARARDNNLPVRLVDLRDYRPNQLKRETHVLIVTATHGLGDPPDGAEGFFEYWLGKRAPKLDGLRYSVLALGDSSYEEFCDIGRVIDERLSELGAEQIQPRVDCDVDFESDAESWTAAVFEAMQQQQSSRSLASPAPVLLAVPDRSVYDRESPFAAPLMVDQKITGRGSTKDVRHIELSLEDSGLRYLPGDSLGVMAENPPETVAEILATLRLDGATPVKVARRAESITLAQALASELEITQLSRGFLEDYSRTTGQTRLQPLLEDRAALSRYIKSHQLVDVLHQYPGELSAQGLADAARRLTPRLYSIASSPDANPDEAHLTVAVVASERGGRPRWGAASSFLTREPETVPVFVETNDYFRLPADPDAPIIMVGAGTGIAPYRAFVEHRRHHGQNGDSWLFLGDRSFSADFLYQLEWQRYLKQGVLTRMDVAFSRDQESKIYVQQRLQEHSRGVYDWLERGAHFYLCGDSERLAPAVHQTLVDIVAEQRGKGLEEADAYVKTLKAAGRYQRDVY